MIEAPDSYATSPNKEGTKMTTVSAYITVEYSVLCTPGNLALEAHSFSMTIRSCIVILQLARKSRIMLVGSTVDMAFRSFLFVLFTNRPSPAAQAATPRFPPGKTFLLVRILGWPPERQAKGYSGLLY